MRPCVVVVVETMGVLGLRDPFSALSHLLGALLSLAALPLLVRRARAYGCGRGTVCSLVIYAAALVATFLASTLFHAFDGAPERLMLLKRLDHAAIFLTIAGTGTAIYSTVEGRRAVWLVLGLWGLSLAGIVLKMVIWPMALWFSASIYLVVGWVAVGGMIVVLREVPRGALRPLLGGGVVFTIGAVAFATERPVVWEGVIEGHEVFHVLVLLGVALHFLFVYERCTRPGTPCPDAPSRAETVARDALEGG